MQKINLAIIGIGHLGSKHLKVLRELRDYVEIKAICDINADPAQKLAQEYGIPFFSDYRDLCDNIDAVSICVPTEHHHGIATFCLGQKKHVFVEKPITTTLEQADELIELAQKNKVKLQVGHVERFNAAFESIKHFTYQPLFIECHRMNRFPNRSLDIGVVMDLMIHDIDIILGLINSPIEDIQATGVNVLTSKEDIASVRLTFQTGCVCNLTASRISEEVMRKIRIFQKDTYISLDYVNQEAYICKKHEHQILKHSLPIEKQEPLKRELQHFIECIQNDQTPLISGKEAREALSVVLDIEQIIWKRLKKIS